LGAAVTTHLAYAHSARMIGIHINLMMAVARDPAPMANPTDAERHYFDELAHWNAEERGYQWIQGTRPQTLAFALTDSPAGLAAWIIEKFRAWSDCGGDVETAIGRDRMLADISLYWFTGCIGSSFWPYYARLHDAPMLPRDETISVPTGYAEFPREILRPPRSMAERVFTDLRSWTVMPKGGHFAALEQPALLAEDVRGFFRLLRG
jgi:microsomal epoxide hydrolase